MSNWIGIALASFCAAGFFLVVDLDLINPETCTSLSRATVGPLACDRSPFCTLRPEEKAALEDVTKQKIMVCATLRFDEIMQDNRDMAEQAKKDAEMLEAEKENYEAG